MLSVNIKMKRICHLVFRLLFLLDGGVWSLRNLSISVPRAVVGGEAAAAVLRCSYELEGAALYSIRWYRAETEFYRFVPRELPPSMVFPLPGASVDLTQSDAQQVRIVGLHRRLSAHYQCEVTADAPLFHTDIRSAPLTVVDPPLRAPRLAVSGASYARGAVVHANCSVDEAYPAPNISWFIEDVKIGEWVSHMSEFSEFRERGAFSRLELTVLADSDHHYTHEPHPHSNNHHTLRYWMVAPSSRLLRVSCAGSILGVWARASEPALLREDDPRPASVTGEHHNGASYAHFSSLLAACVYASFVLLHAL